MVFSDYDIKGDISFDISFSDIRVEKIFNDAIRLGYRQFYLKCDLSTENTSKSIVDLGDIILKNNLKRDQVLIIMEVSVYENTDTEIEKRLKTQLKKMDIDYVDLCLLRIITDIDEEKNLLEYYVWDNIKIMQSEGLVKAVGVCDFSQKHLKILLQSSEVTPIANNLVIHPRKQQKNAVEFCINNGIMVTSSYNLENLEIMSVRILRYLAEKYEKTVQQIWIRWCLQIGVHLVIQSVSAQKIADSLDICDFTLTGEEMSLIGDLDEESNYIELVERLLSN